MAEQIERYERLNAEDPDYSHCRPEKTEETGN
jgi:hypothetical protein